MLLLYVLFSLWRDCVRVGPSGSLVKIYNYVCDVTYTIIMDDPKAEKKHLLKNIAFHVKTDFFILFMSDRVYFLH